MQQTFAKTKKHSNSNTHTVSKINYNTLIEFLNRNINIYIALFLYI